MKPKQNSVVDDDHILQRVIERLKSIDYDFSAFSIMGFARWVSAARGLAIHIEPCETGGRPLGFWFLADNEAHIRYNERLPDRLKTVTVLHELLHIYFGHSTLSVPGWFVPMIQFHPGLAARDPLQKSIEDREAEIAAVWLLRRITAAMPQDAARTVESDLADLFGKVVDT